MIGASGPSWLEVGVRGKTRGKNSQTLDPILPILPGGSRLESSGDIPLLTENTDVSCSFGVAKGASDLASVPGVVAAYRT